MKGINYLIFICLFLIKSIHSKYSYQVKYLDVKLDHFTFTNNATFKLKYLVNDKYWALDGGPIFFYTGNEGAIEVFCENTGFMWEIAEKFKALIVFAEHRYYGYSLPFGNHTFDTVENRGYLSSEQALEDFVDVIEHITKEAQGSIDTFDDNVYKLDKRYPVIAFGGSYGGMLAAWFRMKYPHIVQGALAASAPIWNFPDMAPCNSYNKIVTRVFRETDQKCHDAIKKSWIEIDKVTSTDQGKSWLTKEWKLCTPIQTENDAIEFKNFLTDMYSTMAMVNYPYPNDFLLPLPGHPIKAFCELLKSSTREDPLLKLLDAAQIYLNGTKAEKCFAWKSGSSIADLGLEGWYLQTCTEMVMPFCSTKEEMFEPMEWNFEEFKESCQKSFQVTPIEDMAEKVYGGLKIRAASNIIFSNGHLDPWSGGGVLKNISDSLVAIIIPEGAHHLDLRESNKEDPKSVIEVRKYYQTIFKKWIKEFKENEKKDKDDFIYYRTRIVTDLTKETNDTGKQLKIKNFTFIETEKHLIKMDRNQKKNLYDNYSNYISGTRHPKDYLNIGMYHRYNILKRMSKGI